VPFWKREKQVKEKLQRYFSVADKAVELFEEALRCWAAQGNCEEFRTSEGEVHKAESRADDLRHEIEKELYARALLPEARDDLLNLLEAFDRIPNLVENVLFMVDTQQVTLPAQFRDSVLRLLAINCEGYRLMRQQVDLLFTDPDGVGGAVEPVDAAESESDRLERELIRRVFRADIHRVDQLLLRELITLLGDITDHAENVSRRLEILALKRRV